MLFRLRYPEDEDEEPWTGQMVGVDYSKASVDLACRIAAQKHESQPYQSLSFERWDLLEDDPGDWLGDGFDVILDKGTFDAISLMDTSSGVPNPCETYRVKVVPLIKPGCFFVVTSCNWTKQELQSWLAPSGSELSLYKEAKYPTFSFGGKTGQSIVTLVFQRR